MCGGFGSVGGAVMGFFVALLVCLVLVLVVLPALGSFLGLWCAVSPAEERSRMLRSVSSPRWAWWRDTGLCFALGWLVLSGVAGCVVAGGGSPWVCVVLCGALGGWLGWQGAGARELSLPNRRAGSGELSLHRSQKVTFYLGINNTKGTGRRAFRWSWGKRRNRRETVGVKRINSRSKGGAGAGRIGERGEKLESDYLLGYNRQGGSDYLLRYKVTTVLEGGEK